MKLADNAKFWWRFWSVRLSAVGAILMGVVTAWPDSILYLWGAMPSEVRGLIPQQFVTLIAMFIFVMSAVSRVVKQAKIERLSQQAERVDNPNQIQLSFD